MKTALVLWQFVIALIIVPYPPLKSLIKLRLSKKLKKFGIKKRSLFSGIPTKIIKQFGDLFANLETSLNRGRFSAILKIAEVTSSYKKRIRSKKTTADQLAYYQISQKFMRELCIIKSNE